MESQSQNPEFRINPENFHSCPIEACALISLKMVCGYPPCLSSCLYINTTYRYGSV